MVSAATAHRQDSPTSAATGWPDEALRSIWERQSHLVDERVDVLEHAIAALADGRLGATQQANAERAAHMLAGSLGAFGFALASEAAHELEAILNCPSPEQAPESSALLSRIRQDLRATTRLRDESAARQRGA